MSRRPATFFQNEVFLHILQVSCAPLSHLAYPAPSNGRLIDTYAAWTPYLVNTINRERDEPTNDARRYHGAYYLLLAYCFPLEDGRFMKCPQGPNSDAIDYVTFIVTDGRLRPVMLFAVQDDEWLVQPHRRLRADQQMRYQYDTILAKCPIPRLWGLSVLGTRVRIYCGVTATGNVTPAEVPHPSATQGLPDDYLADEWTMEITSKAAFDKINQIVKEIYRTAPRV